MYGFGMAMKYPFRVSIDILWSPIFYIYPSKGIAYVLSNYGHMQYPSNSLDQNNSIRGV